MAFIPKGGKWPNKAEDYPRHPDWLTMREAAAYLGTSVRQVEQEMYYNHRLTPVIKRWRYGCWVRKAAFLNKNELEQLRLRRAATKKPKTKGLAQRADAAVVAVNPLRQWRKEQKRLVGDIAAEVGTSEWKVASWEHGRVDPSAVDMGKLAKLMDVDLADLQMRWAAWRILMLAPLPKKGRIPIKLDFAGAGVVQQSREPSEGNSEEEIPDEVA